MIIRESDCLEARQGKASRVFGTPHDILRASRIAGATGEFESTPFEERAKLLAEFSEGKITLRK